MSQVQPDTRPLSRSRMSLPSTRPWRNAPAGQGSPTKRAQLETGKGSRDQCDLFFAVPHPVGGVKVPLGVEGTMLRTRQDDVMPGISPSGGGPDFLKFLSPFLIGSGG